MQFETHQARYVLDLVKVERVVPRNRAIKSRLSKNTFFRISMVILSLNDGDDGGDYGDDDDDGGDYGGANDDVADSDLKEQHAGNKSKSRGTAKTSGVYLKQSL